MVLVLVTDGDEYFKDHPQYVDGVYSSPLIGVMSLELIPEVLCVGTGIEQKWDTWIQKYRTIVEKCICHMKSRPDGRSESRVPEKRKVLSSWTESPTVST
jgi:hypothetical protein